MFINQQQRVRMGRVWAYLGGEPAGPVAGSEEAEQDKGAARVGRDLTAVRSGELASRVESGERRRHRGGWMAGVACRTRVAVED